MLPVCLKYLKASHKSVWGCCASDFRQTETSYGSRQTSEEGCASQEGGINTAKTQVEILLRLLIGILIGSQQNSYNRSYQDSCKILVGILQDS